MVSNWVRWQASANEREHTVDTEVSYLVHCHTLRTDALNSHQYHQFVDDSICVSWQVFLNFLKNKQSLVGADCQVPKVVVTSRHCIPRFAVDDGKLQTEHEREFGEVGALTCHKAVMARVPARICCILCGTHASIFCSNGTEKQATGKVCVGGG